MATLRWTAHTRACFSRTFAGLLFFLATAGAAVAQTPPDPDIRLQAVSTTRTIQGNAITFWVFDDLDDTTGDGILSRRVPGPEIVVAHDSGLIIELTNNLSEPTSVYIPGQKPPVVEAESTPGAGDWAPIGMPGQVTRTGDGRIRALTLETQPGATRRYVWPVADLRPGTYLYQSGSHMTVQVQMGLYGALRKDASAMEVYPGQAADAQATVVYSEIDRGLHDAVVAGAYGTPAFPTTIDYVPTYFLINGELYNDVEPADGRPAAFAEGVVGSALLLRVLNTGFKTRMPTLLGGHFKVVAEDGLPYKHAKEQYSVILPAGKTKDLLLTVPGPAGKKIPLFDRRLYRTLGSATVGGVNGGNIAYIAAK